MKNAKCVLLLHKFQQPGYSTQAHTCDTYLAHKETSDFKILLLLFFIFQINPLKMCGDMISLPPLLLPLSLQLHRLEVLPPGEGFLFCSPRSLNVDLTCIKTLELLHAPDKFFLKRFCQFSLICSKATSVSDISGR